MHGTTGVEQLTVRADVDIALPVLAEVRALEDAVLPIALLLDRNMRCDAGVHQPAKDLARWPALRGVQNYAPSAAAASLRTMVPTCSPRSAGSSSCGLSPLMI